MDDSSSTTSLPGAGGATGRTWTLRCAGPDGTHEAFVAEAGATLLGYRHEGRWCTEPAPADGPVPAGSGQLLVPWPNRVRDGRWLLDGQVQQLALSEPARGNASHGLLRHTAYRCVEEHPDRVVLAAEVFPQSGYPFRLTHTVTWSVSADGLTATHEVLHHGPERAPVAIGAHPYLRVGDVPVAACTLAVEASSVITVDDRLNPVGVEAVAGVHDWRGGALVADRRVDHGYTDLAAEPDGLVRHRLTAPDGRAVTLWAEPVFGVVQLFLTDRLPGRELALAVEPMTAPADAFNSGTGLTWLETGESLVARWGVSPS